VGTNDSAKVTDRCGSSCLTGQGLLKSCGSNP
jgi:hypothetical protein